MRRESGAGERGDERQIEGGNKDRKKCVREQELEGEGGDLGAILQQRQSPWHLQAQQASDDMLHDSQTVTGVDWTGAFTPSHGVEMK